MVVSNNCWNFSLCAPLANWCPTTQLMSSCCWGVGSHEHGSPQTGQPWGPIDAPERSSATAQCLTLGIADHLLSCDVSTLLHDFLLLSVPGWFLMALMIREGVKTTITVQPVHYGGSVSLLFLTPSITSCLAGIVTSVFGDGLGTNLLGQSRHRTSSPSMATAAGVR